MHNTIFDKIVAGKSKAWIVWEDKRHMAFLSKYPTQPGLTVVISKKYVGADVFRLKQKDYIALFRASNTVAGLLKKAFHTTRVAMIVEGLGVPYAHIRLYPLLGKLQRTEKELNTIKTYYETFPGYITSAPGPEMSDAKLTEIQRHILKYR